MLERVIELTAETLGADASSITEATSLQKIFTQIPWIFLSWLWLWRRSFL